MMTNTTQVPNGNDASSNASSMEELQAELQNNFDKYKTDPKYRKEFQNRLQAISGNSGFVDKNW